MIRLYKITTSLLADFHLAGFHTLMKQTEEVTVARKCSQPSANSLLETENHNVTAQEERNSDIYPISLDINHFLIKPSDDQPQLTLRLQRPN